MSDSLLARAGEGSSLKKDAIGVKSMVFIVIAVTAPLTAVATNLALAVAFGSGIGTVGLIVVAMVVLVVFSAGYVAISRQVVNSAAYYAYVAFGLGRRAGGATAMAATMGYNLASAAMAVLTGYFASSFAAAQLGVDIPWWVLAVAFVVVAWALGSIGVSYTAAVAGWVAITEFALLTALAVSVLIQNPGGFTFSVFAPSEMFSGNLGFALIFVLLSFAGYEAAAIYGEEARGARFSVGRATYASLFLLAAIYVVATWTLVAGVDDVVSVAQQDPGAVLSIVADEYLGAWVGPVLVAMIVASFFAAHLSFHTMASRYLFSTARSGYLPSRLSSTHVRRGTPVVAGTVQALICFVVIIPFAVAGASPLTEFLPAISGVTALSTLLLMSLVSISVVVSTRRGNLAASTWAGLIAPIVSALALLGTGVLVVANYSDVTGSTATIVNLMPLLLAGSLAYGWARTPASQPLDATQMAEAGSRDV